MIGARPVHKVHLRTESGYRCGVGARWLSQFISSSTSPRQVTCLACRRLALFDFYES